MRTTIMLTAWTTAHRIEELMTLELTAQGKRTSQFALLSMTQLLEPVTPTRLASEMGLAPATLSDRLRELVDLGHVRRQPNPHDGRSYVISTTAAGRGCCTARNPPSGGHTTHCSRSSPWGSSRSKRRSTS